MRVLGLALTPLIECNSGLSIDVVAEARHLNLVRREADLAIRPSPFRQQTIYQRRIGRVELALYASSAYLMRHGMPGPGNIDEGHGMIAMSDEINDMARPWLAAHAKHTRIVARSNGREQMATLAAAGLGLACLPRIVGDATPGLRRLTTTVPLPSRALWLGVHRDLRALPRVRATSSAIATALSRLAALNPEHDRSTEREL